MFCADGDLRVMGGNNDMEGRVEICINETWGTICDDNWGPLDAQVACRSLGFTRFGMSIYTNPQYCYITLLTTFLLQVLKLSVQLSLVRELVFPSFWMN